MPAVFGVVGAPQSPDADIEAIAVGMQRHLAHRAEHGFSAWSQAGALMGHGALHLHVRPEVSQPLRLEDGCVLVVDGFVANDQAVRRALGLSLAQPLTDAQLFALALQRWQGRFTEHLHGEFALALWNPRERCLDLWRDHLGARPLCYLQTEAWFGFASEAAALLRLPDAPRRIDPLSFATVWCDDANYLELTSTAFEGIRYLPPAHHLRWQGRGQATPRRYWRLQPASPRRLADEGQYVDAFREVFATAVDRAVRDAGCAGLMLSGGIDSGAVLAARRSFRPDAHGEGLLCVSAVAGRCVEDSELRRESDNVWLMTASETDAVRFEVPAPSDRVEVTQADVIALALSRLHPVDVYLQVSAHACRLARARGCRLMLNGIDGDNVMGRGAYPMAALLRAGQWRQAWRECLAIGNNTRLLRMTPGRVLIHALYHAFAPGAVRRCRAVRRARSVLEDLRCHPILRSDMVERLGLAERVAAAQLRRASVDPQHLCDHRAYWIGYSMLGAEGLVARNGMEIRFPWSDLRVINFFEQLPPEFSSRHGWTKYLARKACEPALGAGAVWHTGKRHLGEVLNRQLVRVAGPSLAEVLVAERDWLSAYYRDQAIDAAVQVLQRPDTVPAWQTDSLLTLACMAGWLRQTRNAIHGR